MAKSELKLRALAMRRAGKSLRDICSTLGVAKSTAALWCREVELTEAQKEALHERKIKGGMSGRQKGADANKRKKAIAQGAATVWARDMLSDISQRDRLIAGAALYWAEGSKAASTTGFIFVNSDPAMIRFMHEWLVGIVGISRADVRAQISINEIHRYRIAEVLNFWSHLLDLPVSSFSKTFFARSIQKKVYDNHSVHYGVLRLSVARSSLLKYKVLQMIHILKPG